MVRRDLFLKSSQANQKIKSLAVIMECFRKRKNNGYLLKIDFGESNKGNKRALILFYLACNMMIMMVMLKIIIMRMVFSQKKAGTLFNSFSSVLFLFRPIRFCKQAETLCKQKEAEKMLQILRRTVWIIFKIYCLQQNIKKWNEIIKIFFLTVAHKLVQVFEIFRIFSQVLTTRNSGELIFQRWHIYLNKRNILSGIKWRSFSFTIFPFIFFNTILANYLRVLIMDAPLPPSSTLMLIKQSRLFITLCPVISNKPYDVLR